LSELINNNRLKQQKLLKEIILELHQGKSANAVKEKFKKLINEVGASEIAHLEEELIKQGIKEEEIQKLCDVHLSIFEDALQPKKEDFIRDHPLELFQKENQKIHSLLENVRLLLGNNELNQELITEWQSLHQKLWQIDIHYQKKEHLLFPFLEKKGVYAPPSVMWSTHDEIRDKFKSISQSFTNTNLNNSEFESLKERALSVYQQIEDMINKEEKVLFPLCQEKFQPDDWEAIKNSLSDFGHQEVKKATADVVNPTKQDTLTPGQIDLGSGTVTVDELTAILNSLPLDITYVDANREVRYFTEGKERIFPRPRTVLGRQVEKCHPPESVHIVDRIINELKTGQRNSADFWLNRGNRQIYIRYLPVQGANGEFLGVLEVTQDISEIKNLTGEKRLLDDK